FRDHYYFTTEDIKELDESFKYLKTENKCIFATEKDATRLLLHEDLLRKLNLPIVVIPIRISFLFNEAAQFDALINDYVYSYFPILETKDDANFEEEDLEVDYEEI